jgi:hypothetical protein
LESGWGSFSANSLKKTDNYGFPPQHTSMRNVYSGGAACIDKACGGIYVELLFHFFGFVSFGSLPLRRQKGRHGSGAAYSWTLLCRTAGLGDSAQRPFDYVNLFLIDFPNREIS